MATSASSTLPALRLMSLEEWAAQDEDETGELVDGLLEDEEVPSYLHEAVVAWLFAQLYGWAHGRGAWVFGSEAKFAVSAHRGRKPDLSVFLAGASLPPRGAGLSRVPPSIAIEVLSPRARDARRDRVEKLRDYAHFGVAYYWLVDPLLRTLEVFELEPQGRYALALSAADGRHAAPGCEGLTLDLDALWSDVDRLPEGEP